MTFKIGILSNTSRSVDIKFDEANKEVKEKTQEVKKEFNTGLKSVELLVDQINGKQKKYIQVKAELNRFEFNLLK